MEAREKKFQISQNEILHMKFTCVFSILGNLKFIFSGSH